MLSVEPATPKSASLTAPEELRRMLEGLISRWTTRLIVVGEDAALLLLLLLFCCWGLIIKGVPAPAGETANEELLLPVLRFLE